MYDKKEYQSFECITVGEMMQKLQKLPQEAILEICGDGDSYCYIHVEMDDSALNLDVSALENDYEEC